ncbi:MAG: type II secretion system protein [Oscillospiraceae bacterium]
MKNKLKGFTLMELMVVIAIIAVLAGALIPSASYFIRNAKLKTANAQAKVVFNAALTVSQEYESKNLSMLSPKDGNPSDAGDDNYFFYDGTDGYFGTTKIDDTRPLAKTFVNRVNKKVKSDDSESCVWAVQYMTLSSNGTSNDAFPTLVSACYASTSTDRYVGCYPKPTPSTGIDKYETLSVKLDKWVNFARTGVWTN